MKKTLTLLASLSLSLATPSFAVLALTQTDPNPQSSSFVDDGVISVGEYSAAYSNGGGSDFGGSLGSGIIHMDTDGVNLYLGFDPGATLNNNVVIMLDSRAGGQVDDTNTNDTGDPGRNLSSNLTRDVQDNYPVAADFSVVIGGFGIVVFELNSGTNLNFVDFQNDQTGSSDTLAREIALSLATIGDAGQIDFFATLGSDTNFMSNEGIPDPAIANSPGFDNGANGGGAVTWPDFNRFIPEPSMTALLGLAAFGLLRRRRG